MKLRDDVFDAETDYGVALLDGRSGEYYDLNPTAALALRTLLHGGDQQTAAQALTTEYDVDLATAADDVRDLVDSLRSAGLVED